MIHSGRDMRIPHSVVFFVPAATFFGLVLPTVGHQIGWTDSGELLAVGKTLGIAHPTGYPLLSLLTRVVLSATPGCPSAFVVNLFSSVCVSVGVGLVALLIVESARRQRPRWRGRGIPLDVSAAAFGGACAYGAVGTVWDQAQYFEVYALQTIVFAGALLSTLIAIREDEEAPFTVSRHWAVSGLQVGLGFANHMSTMYLIPGFVFFSAWGKRWMSIRKRWLVAGSAVVFALTLYLYLPMRAATGPPLNWGDPSSLSSLLAHLSGKQYRVWMFTDMKAYMLQAERFLQNLPVDAGWIACALSLIGIAALLRKDKQLLVLLGLLGGSATFYSFTYDILDLEAYFLLFFVVLGVLAGLALVEMSQRISARVPAAALAAAFVVVGCLLLSIRSIGERNADQQTPEPFARDVLRHVEEGATIFTSKWDFLYSPSLALQTVDGLRPDVLVIDVLLLRDRSWYVRQTRDKVSAFAPETRSSFAGFLLELEKFERGESVVYDVIRGKWRRLLSDVVMGAKKRGPVYVDHEAVKEFSADIVLMPSGFLLREVSEDSSRTVGPLPVLPPIEPKNDEFGADYTRFVSNAFLNHAIQARHLGMNSRADSAFATAMQVEPTNPTLTSFKSLSPQQNR